MAKLTLEYIRKKIAGDPRFDKNIDLDEPGKAFVWVWEPMTWCAADGNRQMESFYIGTNADNAPVDTVGYFNQCVKNIERQK